MFRLSKTGILPLDQNNKKEENIRRMGNTWFTQLRHFLDESGEFWDSKGPRRKLAEYLCSIVKAATSEILDFYENSALI